MKLSPAFFKNPINQTKSTDAADAFDKPILTLNSLRRGTNNVQTNGLPTDNKTTLGLYRFPGGDIGPLDGGIGQPAVPPVPITLKSQPVTFATIGNNVFQPDSTSASLATNALLKRLGEQKFKAQENEPYAAYMAQMKLEREVAEAEKTASVADLNLAREILRSAMAERRKQNEDDYLRKMLDSGMSVEDAKDELDEVRRANALQESRKVEDRSYQSKLLLVNLAKARGIPSTVNEPLTQSGPIMNPAPNDMLATAAGNPGDGFGNSPLDVNRVFLTPDYYKTFLRKGRITDEEMDRQAALSNMIASGTAGQFDTPLMLDAKRREIAIENAAENMAQSLSNISKRALVEPLPPSIFAPQLYKKIITDGLGKKPMDNIRMVYRSFEDMTISQLIIAINRALAERPEEIGRLKIFIDDRLRKEKYTKNDLIVLCNSITGTEGGKTSAVSIPFRITDEQITQAMGEFIITGNEQQVRMARQWIAIWEEIIGASMFAEPKRASQREGDEKKNLYYSSVGAVPSPVQQITEKYGLLPTSARRIANVIGEARQQQLDARTIAEQEELSKRRAVQLMRDFKNKQKADRNAREMAEIEETEGAVASMTRAKRLPAPRRGGKTTITFSSPAEGEMRVVGPSPSSVIEKSRLVQTRGEFKVPDNESAWNNMSAVAKDNLARAYNVSPKLTRKQQYTELKKKA